MLYQQVTALSSPSYVKATKLLTNKICKN